MNKWLLFISLFILGLAYETNVHWNILSQARTPAKVKIVAESDLLAALPKRTVNLDRRAVNSTIHIMQQSHLIFSESWRLIVGTNAIPKSVMKSLASRLTSQLSLDSTKLVDYAGCPKSVDELRFSPPAAGAKKFNLSLLHNDCSFHASQPVAEITWENFEAAASNSVLDIRFHPNQMTDGTGEALSMLNAAIDCHYEIGFDDRILKMNCKNLGQGIGRSEHFAFSKFEFLAEQHDLLIVEADHYRNLLEKVGCVSNKPCLSMHVPLEGKIHLVEDQRKGKAAIEAAVKLAMLPINQALEKAKASPRAPLARPGLLPGVASAPVAPSQESQVNPQNPNEVLNFSPSPDINANPALQPVEALQQQDPSVGTLGGTSGKIGSESEIQNKNEVQIQNQNPAQDGGQIQSQNNQVEAPGAKHQQQDQQQGLPGENPTGGPSAELQPAVDGGESALLQSRQPSGQEAGSVLLPEGQHPGLYR